jgi:hypothetical protein
MLAYDAGDRTHEQQVSMCLPSMYTAPGEPIGASLGRITANFNSLAALLNRLLTYAAVAWPCSQLGCGGSSTSGHAALDAPEHVIGWW